MFTIDGKQISLDQAIDTVQLACDNAPCPNKQTRIAIDYCVEMLRQLVKEAKAQESAKKDEKAPESAEK